MSEAATIDSAPRDGTHILGKDGFWREMWLVRDQYEGEFWRDEFDSEPEPTHWAPLPDAEAVKTSPEVGEMVERFPEINPSNYDHDDACALNAWGCEAHSLLIALDAERGRLREALRDVLPYARAGKPPVRVGEMTVTEKASRLLGGQCADCGGLADEHIANYYCAEFRARSALPASTGKDDQ